MNSSDFFRAHWSRHLCCKALVHWQAPVQPTTVEGDISPSLSDPALLSVVGVVDGQFTGFITKGRRNFIYTSTERTGPGFSAFKTSADRPAQRTRPLTSYPFSQSRVLPNNHEAGHVFSPTRKVRSAFFRTHVYCDYSSCFADPALLSVVGFL